MGRPQRRGLSSTSQRPGARGELSIGALARACGIPVPTLRTWERRYAAPAPLRKPSGHRLYAATEVARLQKVSMLLRRGHRPGEVLPLTSARLDALLAVTRPAPEVSPARRRPAVPRPGEETSGTPELLAAVAGLDRDLLAGLLRAHWGRLGPLRFLQDCAGPLMVAVGEAWYQDRLEVRHEHFATACLAGLLRELREPFDSNARGARVVAATLPGDLHEGGLLMLSVILALRDRRVLYLGPNVPVSEIAATGREPGIEAVALSVSAAVTRTRASKLVTHVRAALPRHVQLWIGGAGAPASQTGFEHFNDLGELDERIRPHA